jgi:hypothetical protein
MTESSSMGHAPPRRPLLPLAVAPEEALVPAVAMTVAALLEEQVELLARTRSADQDSPWQWPIAPCKAW